MNRKLLLVIGIIACLILAGYYLKSGQSNSTKTLVIFGEDSSNLKAYSTLQNDYLVKSGLSLKFEGATFEQAVQKADADFRNGKGDYDIVLQYNFSLAPYVKNQYIADLGDAFGKEGSPVERLDVDMFENALRETCFYYSNPADLKSPPKQFGLPFAANTMLMVYNKDLFEQADLRQKYRLETGKELAPPTNWQDYLAIAEFFTRAQSGLKGVCMQGAGDGWLYYELCNYLFSMGTGTSNKRYGWEEGAPITIATPGNEEVLRYCKRLRGASSGDFFTVGASQQQEIMLQGKTAMALVWCDYIQPLATSKSPHFGFAPVPGKISGLAGGAFYINRKSRQIPAAANFISYALTQENQTKLIEKGLCSALKTAYTPDVLSRVSYAPALRESLERGVFMFEAGSDAEVINSALTTWGQKYMRGENSESEALAQAQKEILAKRGQNP